MHCLYIQPQPIINSVPFYSEWINNFQGRLIIRDELLPHARLDLFPPWVHTNASCLWRLLHVSPLSHQGRINIWYLTFNLSTFATFIHSFHFVLFNTVITIKVTMLKIIVNKSYYYYYYLKSNVPIVWQLGSESQWQDCQMQISSHLSFELRRPGLPDAKLFFRPYFLPFYFSGRCFAQSNPWLGHRLGLKVVWQVSIEREEIRLWFRVRRR